MKDVYIWMGNVVFLQTFLTEEKGKVLFVDPCTIANWSHKCYYCFINEKMFICSEQCWPWEYTMPMDHIKQKNIEKRLKNHLHNKNYVI